MSEEQLVTLNTQVKQRVEFNGPTLKITVWVGNRITPEAEIWLETSPAQARKYAESLLQMADMCEKWEGIPGKARRDVDVHIGTAYILPGAGGPGPSPRR